MEPYVLLLIARSQTLARRLQDLLDPEQCCIRWVPVVSQAMGLEQCPNLVILDVPSSGGARCLARLKQRFPVPILTLTRGGQQPQPGAFRLPQVVQWIQAMLVASSPDVLRAPGISLDVKTRRLQLNNRLYPLPPIGCQILAALMTNCGRVVPRQELFRQVWHTDCSDSSRALDVHIAGLRRLLEPDPRHPRLIVTERGVGYRLCPPGPVP